MSGRVWEGVWQEQMGECDGCVGECVCRRGWVGGWAKGGVYGGRKGTGRDGEGRGIFVCHLDAISNPFISSAA